MSNKNSKITSKEREINQQELEKNVKNCVKLGVCILASIMLTLLVCSIFNMQALLFLLGYLAFFCLILAPAGAVIALRSAYKITKLHKKLSITPHDKILFQGILGIILCLLPILGVLFIVLILPLL